MSSARIAIVFALLTPVITSAKRTAQTIIFSFSSLIDIQSRIWVANDIGFFKEASDRRQRGVHSRRQNRRGGNVGRKHSNGYRSIGAFSTSYAKRDTRQKRMERWSIGVLGEEEAPDVNHVDHQAKRFRASFQQTRRPNLALGTATNHALTFGTPRP
jgi:hypothetical protein